MTRLQNIDPLGATNPPDPAPERPPRSSIGTVHSPHALEHPVAREARMGSISLSVVLRSLENGDLVIPDYQRGNDKWGDREAGSFVGLLLEGWPTPPIFVRFDDDEDRQELVDGLQRLTAIQRWERGEIPALVRGGTETLWAEDYMPDLPPKAWRRVVSIPRGTLVCTRAEAIGFYLQLARSGVPHAEADLERADRLLALALAGVGPTPAPETDPA